MSATFSVSVFPDPDIDDPAALSSHLLFRRVAADPGVMGPSVGPDSLRRYKAFFARS